MSLHFTDRAARTQHIIDRFKGKPEEWGMLKGVLCMDHGLAYDDPLAVALRETIDTVMVAKRMDELNREAIERWAAKPDGSESAAHHPTTA